MATPRIEKVRSRPTTARIPLGNRTRVAKLLARDPSSAEVDPIRLGSRVAFSISSPRNHECYTLEKPFAGADDLGPGKGLPRVQYRLYDDPSYVAFQELTSP